MERDTSSFMLRLARIVLRRAVWISIGGTLLAAVGTYYTCLLYNNLRTNLEELLPSTARSVLDLKRVGTRLNSVENFVVLTVSAHPAESKRFVVDLAHGLEKLPREVVAGVEYRMDTEIDFFQKRLPLFLELNDVVKTRDYIRDRILYERSRRDILSLGLFNREPQLDLTAIRKKYSSQTSLYDRFPDGFYASKDETKRALIVDLPGKASDIESTIRLKGAIETMVASLDPKSYAPDLEVKYTGNSENLLEEHSALVADLKISTLVVVFLVATAMLLFYRNLRATLALVISLFMGTLWTLGVSYFLAGYLNGNSAFLASIVIGNGINFGIIYLARYLEERRLGRNHLRATLISMTKTAKPTLTAALAAGLSYGSLMLTNFRGFNQFGIIGLLGMLLCWVSAYTLLPGFLTVLEKWHTLVPSGKSMPRALFSRALARLIELHPRAITALSFGFTAIAVLTFFFHNPQILELDLNKLRDRNSMKTGSGFYYHYISDIFGKNLSPMVLLTNSRADARQIQKALLQKKESDGAHSQIAWVQTLDDMVPSDQEKKIELLQDVSPLLTPSVVARMPQNDRNWAQLILASSTLKPFGESELPPLILSKFTETNGTRGRIILVDKPIVADGMEENAVETIKLVRDLRSIIDKISPGTAIAGQLPVTADMASAIFEDGPKATLFASIAVLLLVIILFQNLRTIALVSFALWIGVGWLAGIILGINLRINFLNFIALPITFGIGVDYGVNVFQRYREEGTGNILDVIRHTGTAVGLCSLTTIIGYTSLILASNQAFVSFGTLAVLGEICCVTAAVISLPAYLLTRKLHTRS